MQPAKLCASSGVQGVIFGPAGGAAQRLFDVLAVVTAVGPLGSIKRKSDQSELVRRDVTLVDSTRAPMPSGPSRILHVTLKLRRSERLIVWQSTLLYAVSYRPIIAQHLHRA